MFISIEAMIFRARATYGTIEIPIPDTPLRFKLVFHVYVRCVVLALIVVLPVEEKIPSVVQLKFSVSWVVMVGHNGQSDFEGLYRVKFKQASVRNGCRLATRLSSTFDRL